MKHPIFHPGEESRVGRYPADRSLAGLECTIVGPLDDSDGAWRYLIRIIADGRLVKVLEPMLEKVWKRSDWQSLKCDWYGEVRQIWQPSPRRAVVRPTTWKVWK
jgi:hypothetical protein